MKRITIPERFGYPTLEITINGKEQTFASGVEIEVEDSVAEAIENAIALEPKNKKVVSSKVDLTLDAGNRTVECDIPISDLLLRLEKEGYECVNIKFYMYGNPVAVHKLSGSFPDLLRVHYMYLASSGNTQSISFDNVSVKKDGTLAFSHEATIISG